MRLRIVVDPDVGYLAEHDAAEVDRRAHRQAAQRLIEVHHHAHGDSIGRAHGVGLIGAQAEAHAFLGLFANRLAGRRLERETADHDRRERLRIDDKATRIEPQVDTACMPPARVGADVLIVWRIDEHLNRDARAVLVEREADYLADLNAPVKD